MATISLPLQFAASYTNLDQYPNKVVLRSNHGSSQLRALRDRLRARAPRLLVGDADTHIPIRDILLDGKVKKNNLDSDDALKEWLDDHSTSDPLQPERRIGESATKADPRCRFVFLTADTVTSPLKISLRSLERLFSYHQVSPNFLDFLDVYGSLAAKDSELRFSGFREELYLQNPHPGTICPDLSRSGRHFQLCYNLKTVVLKDPDPQSLIPWKIRQDVIHHQFDAGTGVQLWIFGDPHAVMQALIAEAFNEHKNCRDKFATVSQSFRSSLEVHLETARWAAGGWRQHILSLEDKIEKLTSPFVFQTDPLTSHIDPRDLFLVQAYEDKTNETTMVLESNIDNMESLCTFYRDLVKDEGFPNPERHLCSQSVKTFCSRIRELTYDGKMQVRRAQVLAKRVADQKTIFIQLLQTQAGLRAEGLSSIMWRQGKKNSYEAIAMRVITVITLLYLPPTFVSTIFSTDIVKYQGDDGQLNVEAFSSLALQRWLMVCLPLMAFTLLAAFGWYWHERAEIRKDTARLEENYPDTFNKSISTDSW